MKKIAIAKITQSRVISPPQYKVILDPLVEIVIPVLNEEKILSKSIKTTLAYFRQHLPYRFKITIADNGSTDNTLRIARNLARQYSEVEFISINQRGRGRALKNVWKSSNADILSYMDVDLSTGLDDFLPLITPLVHGEAGVATGSRLLKNSHTTRGLKRDFISRCYNKLVKFIIGTKFSDAQCGFKAIRRDVAQKLLPKIVDNQWFFDTELLVKAEYDGLKIHEQSVTWVEDTDSRVNIIKTATDDIKGLLRVKKELKNFHFSNFLNYTKTLGNQKTVSGTVDTADIPNTINTANNPNTTKNTLQKFFLPIILTIAGGLYLFGAMQNHMANSYYSAAVQAASSDWTAWLFGSLDSANYISIDKPPLATMIMGLSARLFGFSTFSMLLPNVLAGVGTIWLTYSIIKRHFGFYSAAIASIVLIFTPVMALMSGFNNPDAILTFMLTASGYALLRALEGKKPILWLGLAGIFTGLAFNTKMLQGFMLLPAFGIVYLTFAKANPLKRLLHLIFAGIITAISSLWWSVLVWLTPAASRPWVGSTNDNNIWSLIFGYNGLGRLFGMGGGGGGGRTGFGGSTGILRMINNEFGPNIGWFLLSSIVVGIFLLVILHKHRSARLHKSSVLFWLLWIITHVVIFSMTSGTIHPYYVVVMSPAISALIGIGIPFAWEAHKRKNNFAWILPVLVIIATISSAIFILYSNTLAWLAWTVILIGVISTFLLLFNLFQTNRLVQNFVITSSAISCLLGPVSYTMMTINQSHVGSIPTSGPSPTALMGSNNEDALAEAVLITFLTNNQSDTTWIAVVNSANESAAIQLTSNQPVMALGGFNGSDSALSLSEFQSLIGAGKIKYYVANSGMSGGHGPGGRSEIINWIKQNCNTVEYGGLLYVVYELII